MKRTDWEIDVIFEPTGDYMTVYLGDEAAEDLTESEVIDIIMNNISIVPRLV